MCSQQPLLHFAPLNSTIGTTAPYGMCHSHVFPCLQAFGGANAQLLLGKVLLPPLVWHAGKVAAAVRFAAVTALGTVLRRQLAPPQLLMHFIETPGAVKLLPLLYACLDEDWYVDLRNSSCRVFEQLMLAVGTHLTQEQRRSIYPELTKRLDDSSNAVRIAVCSALCAFAQTMPPDYCDTNTGYLAAGVIIHMDDSDVSVQEAAVSVMEALARVKPHIIRKEVQKVRERFRSKHYCDRVIAACQ